MLKDIIELRLNGWIPRQKLATPKKLDEFDDMDRMNNKVCLILIRSISIILASPKGSCMLLWLLIVRLTFQNPGYGKVMLSESHNFFVMFEESVKIFLFDESKRRPNVLGKKSRVAQHRGRRRRLVCCSSAWKSRCSSTLCRWFCQIEDDECEFFYYEKILTIVQNFWSQFFFRRLIRYLTYLSNQVPMLSGVVAPTLKRMSLLLVRKSICRHLE